MLVVIPFGAAELVGCMVFDTDVFFTPVMLVETTLAVLFFDAVELLVALCVAQPVTVRAVKVTPAKIYLRCLGMWNLLALIQQTLLYP